MVDATMTLHRDHIPDAFFFDDSQGPVEVDSKLGAFVWGALYGALVVVALLWLAGVM